MPKIDDVDLLQYKPQLRIEYKEERRKVFDPIRKKWYILQPEEFVRQLILLYLMKTLNYPAKRISVERQFLIDGMRKRFDIVVFDSNAHPFILIECKSPESSITVDVAMQIAQYNRALKSKYLWISNGSENLFYKVAYDSQESIISDVVPMYNEI